MSKRSRVCIPPGARLFPLLLISLFLTPSSMSLKRSQEEVQHSVLYLISVEHLYLYTAKRNKHESEWFKVAGFESVPWRIFFCNKEFIQSSIKA